MRDVTVCFGANVRAREKRDASEEAVDATTFTLLFRSELSLGPISKNFSPLNFFLKLSYTQREMKLCILHKKLSATAYFGYIALSSYRNSSNTNL